MSEKKSILQKLKELLSVPRTSRPAADSESTPEGGGTITVEREPDSATEDAVKGTDTAADRTEDGSDDPEAAANESPPTGATEPAASETPPAVEETDSDEPATGEAGPAGDPVDEITGIGPTYAERLGEVGIRTVDDLAAADAATVADAAQASESRAADWIERAQAHD